jgi:hypothetical protein
MVLIKILIVIAALFLIVWLAATLEDISYKKIEAREEEEDDEETKKYEFDIMDSLINDTKEDYRDKMIQMFGKDYFRKEAEWEYDHRKKYRDTLDRDEFIKSELAGWGLE